MANVDPCKACGERHVRTWRNALTGEEHELPACTSHRSRHPLTHEPVRPDDPPFPCRATPCRGQQVCEKHGGANPTAIARAQLARLMPDQATPVRDPIGVMARLAGEADHVRGAVAAEIQRLADDGTSTPEIMTALIGLYERFLDRTVRICEALVKSNYIERHAAIEEAKLTGVLAAVRDGLALIPDPDLRATVTSEIVARLRQLGGAA